MNCCGQRTGIVGSLTHGIYDKECCSKAGSRELGRSAGLKKWRAQVLYQGKMWTLGSTHSGGCGVWSEFSGQKGCHSRGKEVANARRTPGGPVHRDIVVSADPGDVLRRTRAVQRKDRGVVASSRRAEVVSEASLDREKVVLAQALGSLNSIGDFTRFRDNGDDGAELQTAIVTYKRPWPWNLVFRTQVDLVAAVHIADKKFFANLQEELATYDRVLYEMVADKSPRLTNRNSKYRWRPPKRRERAAFSIIGTLQKFMAQILTLDFQLECMDYRSDNWFHADLDFETFSHLQKERGETFFSFAKDLTEISTKTLLKNLTVSPDLEPWRSKLLWMARVFPMPLLGLVVIESVCAPSNAPLQKSPEMKALLELDLGSALKVYIAKQITTDITAGASSLVESSVIIGERNRAAMEELQEAINEGCKKIAIFYGSGHLPDMHTRLTRDFGLEPTNLQWRTAWSIQSRKKIQDGLLSSFLGTLAKVSGWPLNRYQTLALLFLSGVAALDLWFWELCLRAITEYAEHTIVFVVNLLEQGWNL